MPEARWAIGEGNRIQLLADSGESSFPSAQDVFRAAFRGLRTVNGLSVVEPGTQLPQLAFSPFPAEPALRVAGTPPGPVTMQIGVATDAGFCETSPGTDSVICGDRWYPIETEAVQELRAWLESSGLRPETPIGLGGLILLRKSAGTRLFRLFDETQVIPAAVAAAASSGMPGVPGLNAVPYPYQRDGIGFLRLVAGESLGCILADEMGLGKTLQAIGLMLAEKASGRGPSLVVCPATVLENWRRELTHFAPDLTVAVHAGVARPGAPAALTGHDVTITSYDTAVRDEPLLSKVPWNVVVLDEAQNIRNPAAQRTVAVKRLPRRVSVAVTGTPVENRLEDLWSLADFALPGLLGDAASFRESFSDDINDARRLAPVVAPIILRRRVADVAGDLPPRIEIPQPVQMVRPLAELYESERLAILREHGKAAGLVAVSRLRQVCAHPMLVSSWSSDPAQDMPKYQRLLEIMEEVFEAGERMLVFCSWQGMADVFMRDIPRRWPMGFFSFIDGRVRVPQRQPVIDEFFAYSGSGALFLNPKAAGAGLNITAANHVVHYTPEWNPAVTDQASRRAWRRKQTKPVTIHYLYFADTVEEVMMERGVFKRQLADGAVKGHEGDADAFDIMRALEKSPLARAAERTQ